MRRKKFAIFWGIVLAVGLLLVGSAGAVHRTVLMEMFSNCN